MSWSHKNHVVFTKLYLSICFYLYLSHYGSLHVNDILILETKANATIFVDVMDNITPLNKINLLTRKKYTKIKIFHKLRKLEPSNLNEFIIWILQKNKRCNDVHNSYAVF